jgi:hypothetical protein
VPEVFLGFDGLLFYVNLIYIYLGAYEELLSLIQFLDLKKNKNRLTFPIGVRPILNA